MESMWPGNAGGWALHGTLGQQVVNGLAASKTLSSFPPQVRSAPCPAWGSRVKFPSALSRTQSTAT